MIEMTKSGIRHEVYNSLQPDFKLSTLFFKSAIVKSLLNKILSMKSL